MMIIPVCSTSIIWFIFTSDIFLSDMSNQGYFSFAVHRFVKNNKKIKAI